MMRPHLHHHHHHHHHQQQPSSSSSSFTSTVPDPIIQAAATAIEEWVNQNKLEIPTEIIQSPFVQDKHTFLRYSIARKGDITAALNMYKASLDWRKIACTGKYSCPPCEKDPTAHCFFPIGTDIHNNPVIYGNPPRASQTNVEETVRHVVHQLEYCWNPATSEQGGGDCLGKQWIWVVDFNGFGMKHALNARLGISFASTFANHFPERLHTLFLLNPPTVFSILLSALRPFADERTLSKIHTINGNADTIIKELTKYGLNVKDNYNHHNNSESTHSCSCTCSTSEYKTQSITGNTNINTNNTSSNTTSITASSISNCSCTCPNTMLNWLHKTLEMSSEPGNIPPLPPSTKTMQLPNIKFQYETLDTPKILQ